MLRLGYDTNLVELPVSIGKLKCLEFLDISGCIKIMGLPELIGFRKLNISGCSRLKDLPSVLSLEQLQEVILDEETERIWKHFLPGNIHARVVPPLAVGFDVALEEFNRKVLKDGVSRGFPCGITGMAQNQTESWCPVPETSSLTVGFDVLDVWGAMKMEETLISEVRLKQIEGSGSVVKNQLGTKGWCPTFKPLSCIFTFSMHGSGIEASFLMFGKLGTENHFILSHGFFLHSCSSGDLFNFLECQYL